MILNFMHKLDKLCQLGNIINFEYSENFPNSGFTLLIKALGPLPKIAKKIPVLFHYYIAKLGHLALQLALSGITEKWDVPPWYSSC